MASRERIQPQTYWQGKAHTSILSTEFPTLVHLHAIENLPHQSIAYFYFLAWRHCLLHSIHKRDVNLYLIWSKPKWKKELSIEWREKEKETNSHTKWIWKIRKMQFGIGLWQMMIWVISWVCVCFCRENGTGICSRSKLLCLHERMQWEIETKQKEKPLRMKRARVRHLLVFFPAIHSNWITQKFALNFKCNFGNALKQTAKQISKLHWTDFSIWMHRISNGRMKKKKKNIFSGSLNPVRFIISWGWFMCVCQTMDHYFNFSWRSIVFAHILLFIRSIQTKIHWQSGFYLLVFSKLNQWDEFPLSSFFVVGVSMRDDCRLSKWESVNVFVLIRMKMCILP